jgi:hypothetical protein
VATVAWVAFLLEPISDAGIGFPTGLLGLVGTALLGGAWLGVLVARRSARHSYRGWLAGLIIPLGDAAVLAIFLTTQSAMNPPFRLRSS